MFVEKQEITYKQKTDEELDALLNEKLGILIEGDFTIDEKPKEKPKVAEPVQKTIKIDMAPLPPLPEINIKSLLDE